MGETWCPCWPCARLPQPNCRYLYFDTSLVVALRVAAEWIIYIPVPEVLEGQAEEHEVKTALSLFF